MRYLKFNMDFVECNFSILVEFRKQTVRWHHHKIDFDLSNLPIDKHIVLPHVFCMFIQN